jgi:biopolymer transport protein ExbD
MKMARKKLEPKDVVLQMTSMIDIVFLLNVFFMLVNDMTTLQVESITLPIAYQATDDTHPPKGRIVVNVLNDGVVRINAIS